MIFREWNEGEEQHVRIGEEKDAAYGRQRNAEPESTENTKKRSDDI